MFKIYKKDINKLKKKRKIYSKIYNKLKWLKVKSK